MSSRKARNRVRAAALTAVQGSQTALTDRFFLNGPTMPDAAFVHSLSSACTDGLIGEIRGALPLDERSTRELVSTLVEAFTWTVLVALASERQVFNDVLNVLKTAADRLERANENDGE
jgi:hypothetical protein